MTVNNDNTPGNQGEGSDKAVKKALEAMKLLAAEEDQRLKKEQKEAPRIKENEELLAEQEAESFEDQSIGQRELADIEHRKAETDRLKEETNREKTKTEIMEWIAHKAFDFMSVWCAFVALIVWMYFATKQEKIEKEVIITLLGSTTISVVGLVGFIVKGLFGVHDDKKDSKKK